MKGFALTAESHGFSPNLSWSRLLSGLPAIALAQARRAGCRATKPRRSRSESAKLSVATGRSTLRPFGSERLDMSSSTCLTAEGLSTGLPAIPPQRRQIKSKADLPVGLHRRHG